MRREATAHWNTLACPTWNCENARQVRELVRAQVHNASLRQDLVQDALLHFWKIGTQNPGQTRSWYLKSCWFRIRDHLVSGRSIDSFKRRHLQHLNQQEAEDNEREEFGEITSDTDVVQEVAARDALEQLSRRLEPEDKAVLILLHQGYTVCQTAHLLGVSHPYVVRSRHRIAAIAIRIGFSPPLTSTQKSN